MEQTAHPLPSLVENEQPCIRCGYSLIRLPVTSACPECGTSVEHSLRGDMLAYSDPDYVRRVPLLAALPLLSSPSISFAAQQCPSGLNQPRCINGQAPPTTPTRERRKIFPASHDHVPTNTSLRAPHPPDRPKA